MTVGCDRRNHSRIPSDRRGAFHHNPERAWYLAVFLCSLVAHPITSVADEHRALVPADQICAQAAVFFRLRLCVQNTVDLLNPNSFTQPGTNTGDLSIHPRLHHCLCTGEPITFINSRSFVLGLVEIVHFLVCFRFNFGVTTFDWCVLVFWRRRLGIDLCWYIRIRSLKYIFGIAIQMRTLQ